MKGLFQQCSGATTRVDAIQSDKEIIDQITTAFYSAFSNEGGRPEKIDILYSFFIEKAIVIMNVGSAMNVMDVREFIEPRRRILTDGSLQNFREWEVEETTGILGNVAQRFSRYEKSWVASGESASGAGVKSLQFVRTADGWKVAALAWDDF